MNNVVKFKLNETQGLILVSLDEFIKDVSFMCRMEFYWHDNKQDLLIGTPWSSDIVDDLERTLSRALINDLFFDVSKLNSLGILWNEFMVPEELRLQIVEHAKQEGRSVQDDILRYHICATRSDQEGQLISWIYNDLQGNIFLEVSRMFYWPDLGEDQYFFSKDPIHEKFYQFIKDYKSILKVEIPNDVACEWLKQARNLKSIFLENETKDCIRCLTPQSKEENNSSFGKAHVRDVPKKTYEDI